MGVIRLDQDQPRQSLDEPFVQAKAEELPFKDGVFSTVIANHSLEHFGDLNAALSEVSRVLKHDGAFFASVPDASSFTDILYRWLARGGGHVNAFNSLGDAALLIERSTGLPFVGSRLLYSSLSFLNHKNAVEKRPLKLRLLGGGTEASLRAYVLISRLLDRVLGTRLSVYGWAIYFGSAPRRIDTDAWANVCVRCGSGCPSPQLKSADLVFRRWIFFKFYACPRCGTRNFLVDDLPVRPADALQSF